MPKRCSFSLKGNNYCLATLMRRLLHPIIVETWINYSGRFSALRIFSTLKAVLGSALVVSVYVCNSDNLSSNPTND